MVKVPIKAGRLGRVGRGVGGAVGTACVTLVVGVAEAGSAEEATNVSHDVGVGRGI